MNSSFETYTGAAKSRLSKQDYGTFITCATVEFIGPALLENYCLLCTKSRKEAKYCECRKALDDIRMHGLSAEITSTGDNGCPYSSI